MERVIRSDYYLRRKLVKSTYSSSHINLGPNANRHFGVNDYGADRMEAYSIETGALLLVVTAKLNGTGPLEIKTIFKAPGRTALKKEANDKS